MAIKVLDIKYSATGDSYIHEFICDGASDVASLPECATGSTALVVATGDVYVVNASGAWAKLGG